MPIRKDLKKFYKRDWSTVIRPRILARAGDRCEQCKAPNNTLVLRVNGGFWTLPMSEPDQVFEWHDDKGERLAAPPPRVRPVVVKIVLGIAHLNHKPGDDRDENLKALCQRCHFIYDLEHHRDTRSARKDRSRPLIALATAPVQLEVERDREG